MNQLTREIHEQIHQQSFTKKNDARKKNLHVHQIYAWNTAIFVKGISFPKWDPCDLPCLFPYERQFLFGLPLERLEQPQHLANVAWAVSAVSLPEMGR